MFTWWGIYTYLNIEQIQTGIIEIMTTAYGSSVSFGSRLRSRSIGHNTYKGRRSNFCSKPTPIHGPVHKLYLSYSYSRSHFGRLPQAVDKKPINFLSQKVSYVSNIIDPVINRFSPHGLSSHLHIYDHSIVIFGMREKC